MDVVEGDKQRLLGGRRGKEATDFVEEAHALSFRRDPRAGDGGQVLQVASGRADDLRPGPVRRRAALLPATT